MEPNSKWRSFWKNFTAGLGDKDMILNIIKAEYINEYNVKLFFNDGLEKTVDLKDYIQSKKHPFFQPLKQVDNFR